MRRGPDSPTIMKTACGSSADFKGNVRILFQPPRVHRFLDSMTSATGKPSTITATKTFITHGGASNVGNKIEAACNNSQATTA
jgi:hypothetical protein